jgi:lysozyme family protein
MRRIDSIAIGNTIGHEGGYVNDPTDRGGETYRGISRKSYPSWKGWKVIDNSKNALGIPQNITSNAELNESVEKFYYVEFIKSINLHLINDGDVVKEVFDSGVNCGKKTACQWLQEAYNLCNQNQNIGSDLTVDGNIGPKTAAAINNFPPSRKKVLLGVLNLLQGERYLNICRNDKTQERFLHGWVANRIILK